MKCKLLPHKRKEILSIQEAKQKSGWEITAFDLPKAWEYSKGDGVKVAVLDTGIDLNHPDLIDNLVPGINLINKRKPPIDDNGHGSHVCGIIGAVNNEIGVVGVAPKSKIIPVKVLDDMGSGSLETVAKGIRWAVDEAGADLICMSLGSPNKMQNIRKAIQYAESKGVVCFCAAGNAGEKDKIYYPADYPESISVGSIDQNFNKAKFSNDAQNLDFFAPGVEILSTVPDSWYAVMSGTSMSSPWVTGVAALLLSYVKKTNTDIKLKNADDYRRLLKRYCVNKNGKNVFGGFGLINPQQFLDSLK